MKPFPIVYFITAKAAKGFPIKIGTSRTDSVRKRLGDLQTAHPYALSCVFVMPGGPAEERAAHAAFHDLHIRGEWFERHPELVWTIAELRRQYPEWKSLLMQPHIMFDEAGARA